MPGWRSWAGSEGRGCSPPTGAVRWTAVAQRSSVLGEGDDSVFPSPSRVSHFVSTGSSFVLAAGDTGGRHASTGDLPRACKPQEN